jgi:recombination protein RecA
MPRQAADKPKKSSDVDAIIASIEKQTGIKGVLKKCVYAKAQMISFGYEEVDTASNCGGIERGKLIEIFGNPSGGKSYLTLKLIASAQKEGLRCCLVDAEQSFGHDWAAKQGVNTEELYIVNDPMSAEQMLDVVVALCNSGEFGLVVVDSVAALIPEKELTGSVSDSDYALKARAMSKACPKIVNACAKTKTTCVFVNQIREKMGVMFGSPETTPGGRSLPFYAHQRIQVTPGQVIRLKDGKKGDDGKEEKGTPVGRKSFVKFVKNKTAAPFGECIIEIIFNEAALNPVVMLCNQARDYKLVGSRSGQFQIKKDVLNEKKNIDTGATSIAELADYLVKNNLVVTLIDAYVKAVEDEEGDETPNEDIVKMKEDASLIKSPLEGKAIDVEVITKKEDIVDDIVDDSVEPEKA